MTIVDEILTHLCEQFRIDGFLDFGLGKNLINYVTSDIILEYSFVRIDDLGMIYHHKFRRQSFYDGAVNNRDFYVIEHMLLRLNFRSLLPWRLEAILKEVLDTKTPKRLIYTQQLETDLFML